MAKRMGGAGVDLVMAQPPHPHGRPIDLTNMREQSVHHLIAYCPNDACLDVSSYPGDTPVPWSQSKVKCGKCGAHGRRIDVRPNWKERSGTPADWTGRGVT